MNAPAQNALPVWLAGRYGIQAQIVSRTRENLEILRGRTTVQMLPVEAGWSAILRLPQVRTGDDAAIELVREAGVVVHPGAFYGMSGEHFMVVSTIGVCGKSAKGNKPT